MPRRHAGGSHVSVADVACDEVIKAFAHTDLPTGRRNFAAHRSQLQVVLALYEAVHVGAALSLTGVGTNNRVGV